MSRELPEGWHIVENGHDVPRYRRDGELLAYVRGQWRPAEVDNGIGPGFRVNTRSVAVTFDTGEVNLDGRPYRAGQRVPVGRLAVREAPEAGLDVARIRADVESLRYPAQVELDEAAALAARAQRGGHPGPARRTTSLRLTEPEFEAIEAAVRLGYGAGLNAVVARLIRDELPEALGRHAVDGLGD